MRRLTITPDRPIARGSDFLDGNRWRIYREVADRTSQTASDEVNMPEDGSRLAQPLFSRAYQSCELYLGLSQQKLARLQELIS